MQSNPTRTSTVGSRSKVKEHTSAEEAGNVAKDKPKNVSTVGTPRYHGAKSSTSDIYSNPKKTRDKIGPGPVTDKNGPKITARDISRSKYKDTSSSSRIVNDKTSSSSPKSSLRLSENPTKSTISLKHENSSTRKASINRLPVETVKRKSSSSTDVQAKRSDIVDSKHRTPRLAKDLPFVGLLVNSPPSKRKILTNVQKNNTIKKDSSNVKTEKKKHTEKLLTNKETENDPQPRQRGKTITLNENEVKVLNQDGIDNNVEMKNLTQKLMAKPKAFYINLDENKPKGDDENKLKDNDENSEDDKYSDDFESYESDFESYKSDTDRSNLSDKSGQTESGSQTLLQENQDDNYGQVKNIEPSVNQKGRSNPGDEEKMLDSGSFDLREAQRSATKVKPIMDDIQESAEPMFGEDSKKQISLTDEGFLEMSSSSAVSGTRALESNDSIERPTFINLTQSKEDRKRRLMQERQKQRATDLLSMITLHQVSYVLFDLKPIPYDSFMAIYGNVNARQTSCQTYDDGVTEEIQTEEIYMENKWTQHPVDFSNCDEHIGKDIDLKKFDDYESKFLFLWNSESEKQPEVNEEYIKNPLRIFLEQKNGVGSDKIMHYGNYEKITKRTHYNVERLSRFLAKSEKKIMKILCRSNTEHGTVIESKWPFSKGYENLLDNVETNPKLFFLHKKPVHLVLFSESADDLLLTIHKKIELTADEMEKCSYDEILTKKCLICLWDLSTVSAENSRLPIKVLVAVENVAICRFRGDSDGLVAAALDDGSIHLWDLSEAASWHGEISATAEGNESVPVRSCAYTSGALALQGGIGAGGAVAGLQFAPRAGAAGRGLKVIGQLCSLHSHGLISLWTIVQERVNKESGDEDVGKAYWSKIKLQKSLVLNLTESIDLPLPETSNQEFNLAAAKRRNTAKRNENSVKDKSKIDKKRPQSSKSIDFDEIDDFDKGNDEKDAIDKELTEMKAYDSWESGLLCTDLKVMCHEKSQSFLVARNCGEVICCDRNGGGFTIRRFKIACDATTITTVAPSATQPFFLAGTDGGVVHLFSLGEARCLVALDCRDGREKAGGDGLVESAVRSIHWEPCGLLAMCGGALCRWELARGDVAPAHRARAQRCDLARGGRGRLAVLTPDGAVEVHRLASSSGVDQELLFKSYVSLL